MKKNEILTWLFEENENRLEELWERADSTRRERVGDAVHIRGLIEFSNYCRSNCLYCGMRRSRTSLPRYRMTREEILAAAGEAVARGYGTIVMQSGEDPGLDIEWLAGVIETIRKEMPLTVTLSLGERGEAELERLKEAGADRYYLRFETSDRSQWKRIHPGATEDAPHRLNLLPRIKKIGYETGSGIMVGIPGQIWATVANDLDWFRRLDLDMIGCGPFVPHPDTPLHREYKRLLSHPVDGQVPNTNLATYKVMALARLLCPDVNIPSTTALATLNRERGYQLGLQRGANVLMVNLTPLQYRGLYEIYPAKAGIGEPPRSQRHRVEAMLEGLDRAAGKGPGSSPNYAARQHAVSSHAER